MKTLISTKTNLRTIELRARNSVLRHAYCAAILPRLKTNSVDLLLTDPPYESSTVESLPVWCDQWRRILKPSASLYVFASPKHADAMADIIGQSFNVLNVIRWQKSAGWHRKVDRRPLRQFTQPWEAIIFAEQQGSSIREVRGRVIGGYIRQQIEASNRTPSDVRRLFPSRNGTKTNLVSCWYSGLSAPSADQYAAIQRLLRPHLPKPYDELIAECEGQLRTFNADALSCAGDIWNFEPVHPQHRVHPSQKPLPLLEQIISVSSKPGDRVLDPFMGSGSTGVAAVSLGRKFTGVERDYNHFQEAERRMKELSRV